MAVEARQRRTSAGKGLHYVPTVANISIAIQIEFAFSQKNTIFYQYSFCQHWKSSLSREFVHSPQRTPTMISENNKHYVYCLTFLGNTRTLNRIQIRFGVSEKRKPKNTIDNEWHCVAKLWEMRQPMKAEIASTMAFWNLCSTQHSVHSLHSIWF